MNVQAEIVRNWLQRARSDLHLGRAALRTRGVLPEDACFHAQQCAEKALKALLFQLRISFPKTHAIEVLLDLLKTNGFNIPDGVDEAFELSEYAVQARYPGEWEAVTKDEKGGRAGAVAGRIGVGLDRGADRCLSIAAARRIDLLRRLQAPLG